MTYQFHAGQQVVCIDDQVPLIDGSIVKDKVITVGEVYTLSWVGIVNNYVFGEYLGVCLQGIESRFGAENAQPHTPYAARRFRPLVKDRIGSLRALLVPGRPLAPSIEEPRVVPKAPAKKKVKEEEKV